MPGVGYLDPRSHLSREQLVAMHARREIVVQAAQIIACTTNLLDRIVVCGYKPMAIKPLQKLRA